MTRALQNYRSLELWGISQYQMPRILVLTGPLAKVDFVPLPDSLQTAGQRLGQELSLIQSTLKDLRSIMRPQAIQEGEYGQHHNRRERVRKVTRAW